MKETVLSMAHSFGVIVGTIQGWFLWAVALYFAYKWISWNFNLPPMTYLDMVCMFGSLNILCGTLRKIFPRGAKMEDGG